MIVSEHGDNYHDGENDIDRHVSDTCSFMCRLGAFWYEETACAARLGCVELRRNASVEERRAGAAMLRTFLHLVKRLQASQAELKAVLKREISQASAPHMQPARPRRAVQGWHPACLGQRWQVRIATMGQLPLIDLH